MDWAAIYDTITRDPDDPPAYRAVKHWLRLMAARQLAGFPPDLVEDVIEEACGDIYVNIGKARGRDTFNGWAMGQFLGARQRVLRRLKRTRDEQSIDAVTEIQDDRLDVLDRVVTNDLLDHLKECIEGFSERERRGIRLRLVEGQLYREIGEQLELKEATARKMIQIARAKLRACLETAPTGTSVVAARRVG